MNEMSIKKKFNYLVTLWKDYNNASKLLTEAMGGTANEVGEFAERLVCEYYNAKQLNASHKSTDLITKNGKLIQVKSRKIEKLTSTSLNVIRSWDFDVLVVVLFSKEGNILKAIQIDSIYAKQLSQKSKHQNGDILTTSHDLLNNVNAIDITIQLQNILNGENIVFPINEPKLIQNIPEIKKIENNIHNNTRQEFCEPVETSKYPISSTKLLLEFVPSNEKIFKQELLRTKRAKRTWYYKDMTTEKDMWEVSNLTIESNLRNNIHSNNRARAWKKTGLIKIKFEILESYT